VQGTIERSRVAAKLSAARPPRSGRQGRYQRVTEAEIIRARNKELRKMLAALEAALQTIEQDKAVAAF
jgi:hypothetical protein